MAFADSIQASSKGLNDFVNLLETSTVFFSKEVKNFGEKVYEPLVQKFSELKEFLEGAKEKFKDNFSTFCKELKTISENIVQSASEFGNKLCEQIKNFFESVSKFTEKYSTKEKGHAGDIELKQLSTNLDKQLAAANPDHKGQASSLER